MQEAAAKSALPVGQDAIQQNREKKTTLDSFTIKHLQVPHG